MDEREKAFNDMLDLSDKMESEIGVAVTKSLSEGPLNIKLRKVAFCSALCGHLAKLAAVDGKTFDEAMENIGCHVKVLLQSANDRLRLAENTHYFLQSILLEKELDDE
jgi:hypothetical protein